MEPLLLKIGQINNTASGNPNVVLERVLRTTIHMLQDRGYSVTNDCRTTSDIVIKMQDSEHIIYAENEKDSTSTIVFFHNEERVCVKQMRNAHEQNPDHKVIIISLEGPTAFTKKETEQSKSNTQFFTFKDMCVNITRHHLVPKHEKIDKTCVKHSEHISDDEWPKLYTTDKIAQYYDFKPGDVIRITRMVGYQEPVYFYRLVCTPSLS